MDGANHRFQYLRSLLESRFHLFVAYAVALSAVIYAVRLQEGLSVSTELASADDEEPPFEDGLQILSRTMSLSEYGDYLEMTVWDRNQANTQYHRYDAYTGRELLCEIIFRNRLVKDLTFCHKTDLWFGITLSSPCQLLAGRGSSIVWEGELPGQTASEDLRYCILSPEMQVATILSSEGSLWSVRYNDQGKIIPSQRSVLEEPCFFAALSPLGDQMALITESHRGMIWDLSSEEIVGRFQLRDHSPAAMAWSRDSRRVITSGHGRHIAVWNVPTGELVREWQADHQFFKVAALSHQGKLAAVGDGPRIRLWNVDDGQEQLPPIIYEEGVISHLQFADEDRTLFSADGRGVLCRWSLTDHRNVWKQNVLRKAEE